MKKAIFIIGSAIVIIAAIVSILFAIAVSIPQAGFLIGKESFEITSSPTMDLIISIITFILALLIILISLLVLFNIEMPKLLRMLTRGLAIIFIIIFGFRLIGLTFLGIIVFVKDIAKPGQTLGFIAGILIAAAVIITMFTYLMRSDEVLNPELK
jgi:nitric oxide reductase large subunit